MKVSTKGRYGLRAMVDLAIYYQNDPVALKHIAGRQNISEAYLEQIFSALRKAGLVKSIKGPQGGYILGNKMSRITVGQVLRIMEGNLFSFEDASKDNKIELILNDSVWLKINDSISHVVDTITLDVLVEDYKAKIQDEPPMYYI